MDSIKESLRFRSEGEPTGLEQRLPNYLDCLVEVLLDRHVRVIFPSKLKGKVPAFTGRLSGERGLRQRNPNRRGRWFDVSFARDHPNISISQTLR